MADSLKSRSAVITEGPDRAPTRAMLKAAGFSDEDLRRPIIGVANTWIEIGPCNYHLRRLAVKVKEGIRAAGGTPMEFNTVSISDGISMGVEGMKCSLISREVIADSIELVARGNHFDGLICLSGCDKTNPGVVMALARLDIPGLALYGGSIAPGHLGEKDLTIQDVFEAVGAYASQRIDAQQFLAIENAACPGAGACGGQFTANTMSTVMEFLGISPMGSNGIPATVAEKDQAAFDAGKLVMELLKYDLRPSKIITRKSIENAIASVAATGGSTNAVLHLLAIAREAGVEVQDVTLADSMGWATPRRVADAIGAVRDRFDDVRIALHLHDTRGQGIACAYEGLRLGVTAFDAAVAGLGGCPFAGQPGAPGNIATEELALLCEEMGISTGLNIEALIEAGRLAERIVGHRLPSAALRSGTLAAFRRRSA